MSCPENVNPAHSAMCCWGKVLDSYASKDSAPIAPVALSVCAVAAALFSLLACKSLMDLPRNPEDTNPLLGRVNDRFLKEETRLKMCRLFLLFITMGCAGAVLLMTFFKINSSDWNADFTDCKNCKNPLG